MILCAGEVEVEFVVRGHVPPKKDGATSMWSKDTECLRLVALRDAALRAMTGMEPFRLSISVSLEIFLPGAMLASAGDLDNFVTGVCDGLMAAHPKSGLSKLWESPEHAHIHPSRSVAIVDDGEVTAINATKAEDVAEMPWYRIRLKGRP